MESMSFLDITIKYFNVMVFIMCVVFGMTSFFASWIAWREMHRRRNIVRGILAAYNIAEDTLAKGSIGSGSFRMDPAVVQNVFNNLQEILNAVYGELTGNPVPAKEERLHGSRKLAFLLRFKKNAQKEDVESEIIVGESMPRPPVEIGPSGIASQP
jgi:hypothetical protein